MAEVAAAGFLGTVGPYLPLAMFGGAGVYLATRQNAKAPEPREPSKDERMRHQHEVELAVRGAPMGNYQANYNKAVLMGSAINDAGGLDLQGGGYNPDPDVNPLEPAFKDHIELSAFDRDDTMTSIHAAVGEVRMRKRQAFPTTLTAEIHNPRMPDRVSTLTTSKHVPAYANETQIKRALVHLEDQVQPSQSLRKHHGTTMFARAPGQSFRYEG